MCCCLNNCFSKFFWVVNFAAGGVATPQDAALMMELGADGVFVGSGIFKSEDPEKFAKAIGCCLNNCFSKFFWIF
jgi:pyridoxal biosynthesis lyase PdxS